MTTVERRVADLLADWASDLAGEPVGVYDAIEIRITPAELARHTIAQVAIATGIDDPAQITPEVLQSSPFAPDRRAGGQ